jgi:hypothetical protein
VQWKSSSEPPATLHLSDDELKGIIIDLSDKIAGIKGYPCHTQSVERGVKLVTDSSKLVCGAENRDAII